MSSSLAEQQQQELSRLKRGRGRLFKLFLYILGISILLFAIFTGREDAPIGNTRLDISRRELLSSGSAWASQFVENQYTFREWILNHGIASELRIFDSISSSLFSSAAGLGEGGGDGAINFFVQALLSLHFAFLRVSFLIIASFRLWIVIGLGAVLYSIRSFKVHTGRDILGETGNGRFFYSGIRVHLDDATIDGAPRMLVTGLACPEIASASNVKASDLGRVLSHFGAENNTTLALGGIVTHYKSYPGYVAPREEIVLLDGMYKGAPLLDTAAFSLMNALELHKEYSEGRGLQGEKDLSIFESPVQVGEKLSAEDYAALQQRALHRALTQSQRKEIATLSSVEVATAVLALEAGKVLAYGKEGGRWVRRSNFPQLSARAMLHSIPTFSDEYEFDRRTLIRRAIIYGSRSSVFAPVRFPLDLSDATRALRQWIEVLMACPHELSTVTDEVEMFGIISEANKAWENIFFERITTNAPEIVEGIFSTPGNLCFVPVRSVLSLLKSVVPRSTISRLEELVAVVSQKQKLQFMSADVGEGTLEGSPAGSAHERFAPPLSFGDMRTLAQLHGVSDLEVRDWSSLRVILTTFGWLARRVGDYSVPTSSLIFGIFKNEPHNREKIFGVPGMVPFRGTRFAARLGKSWYTRFATVGSATMAESKEDYDKKLQGIEDTIPDEDSAGIA